MPHCFVPGCSNRSDKDPEKRLSFHRLLYINKKLAKKAKLDQPLRNARFYCGKTLEKVYVCNDHFTGDCYEVSNRYELLDAKKGKRKIGSVLSQFLVSLSLNKPSKILRLQ